VQACEDQECGAGGLKACAGDGYMVCDDHDNDGCLEWSRPIPCPDGGLCSGGECLPPCMDECATAGLKECMGNGTRTCGAFDPAGCLTWGDLEPCGANEQCQGGQCVPRGGCPEADCDQVGTTTCSGSNGYKICGADPENGCPRLSHFISCQDGNSCSAGACNGACIVPELMLVVDRSSSMEGDKWEYTEEAIRRVSSLFASRARLGLRLFPGGGGCEAGEVVPMELDNASRIRNALSEPSTASATPIAASLEGLPQWFGDPNQGEVVILLTDGSETCGEVSDLLDAVTALRSRGVTLYAVGIGQGFDELLLKDAANAGGSGAVRSAASGPALEAALLEILDDIGICCVDDDRDGHGVLCALGGDCDDDNRMISEPQCSGRQCGPDGCGGTCGSCQDPGDPNGRAECDNGTCVLACDHGHHRCGDRCASDTSPATCGASCDPCPEPENAIATCKDGICGHVCAPGTHACGEACYPDDDPEHCGEACKNCPVPPGGFASCVEGTCGTDCPSDRTICSGSCVDTETNAAHCGGCDKPCGTGASCSGGGCVCHTTWTMDIFHTLDSTSSHYSTDVGDVNGDSHLDLVMVGDRKMQVRLGAGDGSFADPVEIEVPSDDIDMRSVTIGHLLGDDAHADAAVVCMDRVSYDVKYSQMRFYAGAGDGTFTSDTKMHTGFTPNAGTPAHIIARDLNSDGRDDIVVLTSNGGHYTGAVKAYIQADEGGFERVLFEAIDGAWRLTLGDFNGDQSGDIVVGKWWGDCMVFTGGPSYDSFSFSEVESVSCGDDSAAAAGDLDADGNDELIVASTYYDYETTDPYFVKLTSYSFWYSFSEAASVLLPGKKAYAVAVADLDADGKQDAVLAYDNDGYKIRAFMGSGDNTLCPHVEQSTWSGDDSFNRLIPADIDEDGCMDIVLATKRTLWAKGICGTD